MESSVKYWLWLSTRRGLSSKQGANLFQSMGRSIQRVYLAEEDELSCYDLKPQTLQSLLDKSLDSAHHIMGLCDKEQQQIITLQDAIYPRKLGNLVDPPLVLYAKGKMPLLDDSLTLAMVGARNASVQGVELATEMAMTLTRGGAYLITGMAEGIDSAVVEGALKAGGPLVSVVAGGIDLPYPRQNARFYQDVATVGVVLSEYPPKTAHKGNHFRPRNRILSGLSNGVVVVECLITGGTMLTAGIAEEQERDLFAVPGFVRSPNSRGPHRLIQQHGAYLTTSALDIMEFYRHKFPLLQRPPLSAAATQARVAEAAPHVPTKEAKPKQPKPKATSPESPKHSPSPDIISHAQQLARFTDDQIGILSAMAGQSHSIDGLVELCQIPAKRVLSAITILQMEGIVEECNAGLYQSKVILEPR